MKYSDRIASWWRGIPLEQKKSLVGWGVASTLVAGSVYIVGECSISPRMQEVVEVTRMAVSRVIHTANRSVTTIGDFKDQSLDVLQNIQKPQE